MKEYVTIGSDEVVCETVIEKSRFIAAAIRADTAEQAQAFVEAKRKKYYDATHNCFAYVVGDKARFGDDGEPQGTAGMPIYECIRQNGLDRVCVVVTRYFGGVKLGAGGLTRAYGGCCADALSRAERVEMTDCTRAEAVVDYSCLKPLRKALQGEACEENAIYGDKVTLLLLFPTVSSTTISHIVSENTLGKGVFTVKERLLANLRQQN